LTGMVRRLRPVPSHYGPMVIAFGKWIKDPFTKRTTSH
jgi:hypothetical protein